MIFVDTSAIVAILTKEGDRKTLIAALAGAPRRVTSALVRLEACMVLANRLRLAPRDAEKQFDKFLFQSQVEEVPIDPAFGARAVECFERFGKGRHAAALNLSDCMSYACAKSMGARLLFKGDDFAKTDANTWALA